MSLLDGTVFSGERCGKWVSCHCAKEDNSIKVRSGYSHKLCYDLNKISLNKPHKRKFSSCTFKYSFITYLNCQRKVFQKKIYNFSLLMCKQYCSFNCFVHLNSYFSKQAAQGATLFCEMFHGDPKLSVESTFMNSMTMHIMTNMTNVL